MKPSSSTVPTPHADLPAPDATDKVDSGGILGHLHRNRYGYFAAGSLARAGLAANLAATTESPLWRTLLAMQAGASAVATPFLLHKYFNDPPEKQAVSLQFINRTMSSGPYSPARLTAFNRRVGRWLEGKSDASTLPPDRVDRESMARARPLAPSATTTVPAEQWSAGMPAEVRSSGLPGNIAGSIGSQPGSVQTLSQPIMQELRRQPGMKGLNVAIGPDKDQSAAYVRSSSHDTMNASEMGIVGDPNSVRTRIVDALGKSPIVASGNDSLTLLHELGHVRSAPRLDRYLQKYHGVGPEDIPSIPSGSRAQLLDERLANAGLRSLVRNQPDLVKAIAGEVPTPEAIRQFTWPQAERYRLQALHRAVVSRELGHMTAADVAALPPSVRRYIQLTGGHSGFQQKTSAVNDDVEFQDHQSRLNEAAKAGPVRKMLIWGLGSGKTLGALSAAEQRGGDYLAVTPAALRNNVRGEANRFIQNPKLHAMSYSEIGLGKQPPPKDYQTVILDEAHRLRNLESAQSKGVMELAQKAPSVLMLSGTPVVNGPGDLATPMSILTGKKITPNEFENRYMESKPIYGSIFQRLRGEPERFEYNVRNREELAEKLKDKVDWHQPEKPLVPTTHEDVPVTMGPEQAQMYNAMWGKLPFWARWRMQNNVPMSQEEMSKLLSFLTGPRQVGLSMLPFTAEKDPHKAFDTSTKLQRAHELLQEELKDKRRKALVFSNFIDAGLTPYAARLAKDNVPHAVFHGGLNDADRKKLVDDYNADRIRVALLGPSGTEGLSFKGTTLIQQLDPHFHGVRPDQAVGRGVRYGSHDHLPEELQNVRVQRFLSRLPEGTANSLLSMLGMDRSHTTHATDDRLVALADQKTQRNKPFIDFLKEIGTPKPNAVATAA